MSKQREQLKFKVSTGIKDIVGRDLITDDNIAIFELVKNSFDAHATKVKLSFLDIYGTEPTIIIEDNGKGMDVVDIKKKWLFLAYSAKKEGLEDRDYRSKIYMDKPFAGSKGIGRFSSDRLGKILILETVKDKPNTVKEILKIDWTKFEHKLTDQFINIPVDHYPALPATRKDHGTKLTVTNLRSSWSREKMINLRKSLSKLINPEDSFSSRRFKIEVFCPDEILNDKKGTSHDAVNGEIKNFIFEDLEIRTTKIRVEFDTKGKFVTTELRDGGTLIYKIKEQNPFPKTIHSIIFKVFYLNKSAKDTFKRRMGVRTRDYGSIFVYKNNIRIYPYGEPFEDSFNLDKRKAQKPSVYLGNKDLIGRVEIGDNDKFNETSSRGDGFIKNETYGNFLEVLEKFVIDRLERYVIDVQKWGGSYISIEDESLGNNKTILQNRITSLISRISNSNDIVDFSYDEEILAILDEKQSESALNLVSNLFKIAKNTNNKKLIAVAEKTKSRVEELRKALEEAQKEAKEKAEALKETESENLFLKSIKSQDLDEVVSFVHHIGISAGIIDNYLNGVYKRINRGQQLTQEQLKHIIQDISFENRKIMSISKFATKANFVLFTEEQELNVVEYMQEYTLNVLRSIQNQSIDIKFKKNSIGNFNLKTRPIELNILVDNFLSNSKKAESTIFEIQLKKVSDDSLQITFRDNGIGIPDKNLKRVFDFGFTTTSGSGLGLYHAKQIADRLNADLIINNKVTKGTEVVLTLNKT